jgi:hypothetical protein
MVSRVSHGETDRIAHADGDGVYPNLGAYRALAGDSASAALATSGLWDHLLMSGGKGRARVELGEEGEPPRQRWRTWKDCQASYETAYILTPRKHTHAWLISLHRSEQLSTPDTKKKRPARKSDTS